MKSLTDRERLQTNVCRRFLVYDIIFCIRFDKSAALSMSYSLVCCIINPAHRREVVKIIYGYARVSSVAQKEDRQIDELMRYGVSERNIYVDKQSGKDFKRPQYLRLYQRLRKNDLLVVKSIDRLGRDYEEILQEWRKITKIKNADIIVLDMPLLDTTKNKDLFGTFIADLVLQVLSFVAENERVNILQRQSEGIAAAKKRGVRFGRPKKVLTEEYIEHYRLWKDKKITAKQAAENCGMPLWAFYKYGNRFN